MIFERLGAYFVMLENIAIFFGVPILLTIINIIYIFRKNNKLGKYTDVITFILGIIFTMLFCAIGGFKEWNVPLMKDSSTFELHTPISFQHIPTFVLFSAVAIAGLFLLKKDSLSPIIKAFSISGIIIGNLLCIALFIQLSNNIHEYKLLLMLFLLPLNYILCSARIIRNCIYNHIKNNYENKIQYKNKLLFYLNKWLTKAYNWFIIGFIFIIPLISAMLIILVLFGQKPDSIIKAFTETADWTFSQKIPPPPIEYEGHYLCTVAAGGNEKIVKPIRIGYRQGTKIIVNRQLCIANAFEELISEKLPVFHRSIRGIYDKYGYPLSKHITTKPRANLLYFLMKPLEWLFLIVLYSVDTKPENRISKQYTKR